MATRLLSFLTEIERALRADAGGETGWEVSRMVNYGHNLARMAIAPAGESQGTRGMIFLQSFELGDGSACLKASFNWEGSESFPITTIYSRRETDWRQEASRIATSWRAGPPAVQAVSAVRAAAVPGLVAMAG